VTDNNQNLNFVRYQSESKSFGVAFVLLFFFGWMGAHRFYLGRFGSGFAFGILGLISSFIMINIKSGDPGWLTIPLLAGFIWWLADLFSLSNFVKKYNEALLAKYGLAGTSQSIIGSGSTSGDLLRAESTTPRSNLPAIPPEDRNLTFDRYRIYLVNKYAILKNEALGQFVCHDRLFPSVDAALEFADELETRVWEDHCEQDRKIAKKREEEEKEALRENLAREAEAEKLYEERRRSDELRKSNWKKAAPYILGIVVVIVLVIMYSNAKEEEAYWKNASKANTERSIQEYIARYPKGKFLDQANVSLEDINWNSVASQDQPQGLTSYLEQYKSGRYIEQAREKLARIEGNIWKSAVEKNNVVSLRAYIRDFPSGRNVADALAQLSILDKKFVSEFTPGRIFKDCADCPTMVELPEGSFDMGENQDEESMPIHRVDLPRFAVGRYEITSAEWHFVMNTNEASPKNPNRPVVVRWDDAKIFVQRLNELTGRKYRLLSESEWEYACRAKGKHRYCGSDNPDAVAWHGGLYPRKNENTHPHDVGGKAPNAFGLYDMTGNVKEWVEDCWNSDYRHAPTKGEALTTGDGVKGLSTGDCVTRVVRGGDHSYTTDHRIKGGLLNAAFRRYSYRDDVRIYDQYISAPSEGFRIAMSLPNK